MTSSLELIFTVVRYEYKAECKQHNHSPFFPSPAERFHKP